MTDVSALWQELEGREPDGETEALEAVEFEPVEGIAGPEDAELAPDEDQPTRGEMVWSGLSTLHLTKLAVAAGKLLRASELTYYVRNVWWRPSPEGPELKSYCPNRTVAGQGWFIPQAFQYQVFPCCTLGDGKRIWFSGCFANSSSQQAVVTAPGGAAATWEFAVNDSHYPDNVGAFELVVTAWKA